jgi:hypothetical protein
LVAGDLVARDLVAGDLVAARARAAVALVVGTEPVTVRPDEPLLVVVLAAAVLATEVVPGAVCAAAALPLSAAVDSRPDAFFADGNFLAAAALPSVLLGAATVRSSTSTVSGSSLRNERRVAPLPRGSEKTFELSNSLPLEPKSAMRVPPSDAETTSLANTNSSGAHATCGAPEEYLRSSPKAFHV